MCESVRVCAHRVFKGLFRCERSPARYKDGVAYMKLHSWACPCPSVM